MSVTPWHLKDYPLEKEDVLKTGEIQNYLYVVAKFPYRKIINGYIRIPDGINHPWLETNEPIFARDGYIWGEVTFKKGRWLGFDTMHSWCYWPEKDTKFYPEMQTVMSSKIVIRMAIEMLAEAWFEYNQLAKNGTYEI